MLRKYIVTVAVILLSVYFTTDGFEIIPIPRYIEATRGFTAKFHYYVVPWPPPCCADGQDMYNSVTVEFFKSSPDTDFGVLLCTTQYLKGNWNNETGKCSNLTDPRVPDYEPSDTIAFYLQQTRLEDMDDYYLKLSYGDDMNMSQNDSATLHVQGIPSVPDIFSTAGDGDVGVGDVVKMNCTVGNSNPPAELKWTRGQWQPMNPTGSGVAEDWHGVSWCSVEVVASRYDYGVSYICTATNGWDPTTNSTTINVIFAPHIDVSPCLASDRAYYVVEGSTMSMECKASSNPGISLYQWSKDDNEIKEGYNKTRLELRNVVRSMSGPFKCEAENEIGVGYGYCELDVQYGPEPTFPHEFEIRMGKNATFPCTTDSNPLPERFLWKREGQSDFRQEDIDLFIEHVQPEDAGNYTCDATAWRTPTDSYPYSFTGSGTVTIHVIFAPRWEPFAVNKFSGVPDSETTLMCLLQGYPELTLSWQFGGQDISTGSRYEIETHGVRSTLRIKNVEEQDFGNAYTCTGENDEGQRVFITELLKPGKPDHPQLCSVYNVTDRMAVLQCIPGYNGGGDTSFRVDLQEDQTHRKLDWTDFSTYSSHDSIQLVSVAGMEPNTDYILCVYAVNQYGRSPECYSVKLRTEDGVPSPTPAPPNVGAIVGGVFGGLFFVLLVAGAVLYVRKYGMPKLPERKEETHDYPHRSDDIGTRYGESIPSRPPRSKDYLKEKSISFEDDALARRQADKNEYILHPGMSKIEIVPGKSNGSYQNKAYETDEVETCLDGPESPTGYTTTALVHTPLRSRSQDMSHMPPATKYESEKDVEDDNYKNQLRAQAGLIGQGALQSGISTSRLNLHGIGAQPVKKQHDAVAPLRDIPQYQREQQPYKYGRPKQNQNSKDQYNDNGNIGQDKPGINQGLMQPHERIRSHDNLSRSREDIRNGFRDLGRSKEDLRRSNGNLSLSRDEYVKLGNQRSHDDLSNAPDKYAGSHGQQMGSLRNLSESGDQDMGSQRYLGPPTAPQRRSRENLAGSRLNLTSNPNKFGSSGDLNRKQGSRMGSHDDLASSRDSRMGSRGNLSIVPDSVKGSHSSLARPHGGHKSREDWEFPRDRLRVTKKLGEGSYGEVWWASTERITGREGTTYVAVKMVKELSPQEEKQNLLKELDLMKTLPPHPNVISLLGCCTEREPVFIIMEYAARGNLQDFLRSNRRNRSNQYSNIQTLTTKDLLNFAIDIASGMELIATRQLLHRDLAARNILVSDRLVGKVSDFGLARDIIHRRQYESKTQRRLPLRWMAPEALLDGIYTSKTDVWAFGIVLWEIMTLGSSPYPGLSGPEVMDMIQEGYRMDKPRHCSDAMYKVMKDCWRDDPDRRPSFTSLGTSLRQILGDIMRDPGGNRNVVEMKENMFDILENPPGEKC